MNKTISLKKVAKYSDARIPIKDVTINNFVTTDNLLQNKLGITKATSLPPQDGNMPAYFKNDILIGNIRPYLKKIWFADKDGGNSADVLTIKVNEKHNPKFIYYALYRDDFFEHMMKGSKGTKMPRGDKNQIMEFSIPDISLESEEKIANVLSSLDSKIELNNKINKELEAMAKTLYDYWFVQFDFPDENGKPYKSSGGKMVYNLELKREIPQGWEVKTISELLNVVTGKEDANFAVENGKYPFFTCSENILSCDEYAFEGKAILIAGNGNFNVKIYEGKFNAYQRTYVLIPNDEKFYSVIFYAVKDQLKKLSNGSAGSIIKFITKGDVDNIPLILPKFGNDKIFNKLNNITALIEKNIEQNQELAKLRDWLLPMLMNGQVKVK
ncbi:restriction endonuclease subunit S [Aliarcobacter cryaerophilus]|uniref:restriction endonuclease subunit S n=1 Tax=Aliarcobacter cryaerophilus TaxID=28198 RepID=UPI003DA2D298